MAIFFKNGLKLLFVMLLVSMFIFCSQGGSSGGGGGGGDDGTPTGSTITINLSGATASNGKTFVAAVFSDGADPSVDTPVAGGTQAISGGVATYTTTPGALTEGTDYDIWVFIDEDGSGTTQPNSGDLRNAAAVDVTLNGNQTVNIAYGTLIVQP